MTTNRLLKAPEPIECQFIVPADVEAAWRRGNKDALADYCVHMARDTATFCAKQYQANLDPPH